MGAQKESPRYPRGLCPRCLDVPCAAAALPSMQVRESGHVQRREVLERTQEFLGRVHQLPVVGLDADRLAPSCRWEAEESAGGGRLPSGHAWPRRRW